MPAEVAEAANTVRLNWVLAVLVPSLTVKVTVVMPVTPALGVSVMVRLLPVPLITIFCAASKFGLLDRVVIVSGFPPGESTVNGIAGVGVDSAVIWLGTVEILTELLSVRLENTA